MGEAAERRGRSSEDGPMQQSRQRRSAQLAEKRQDSQPQSTVQRAQGCLDGLALESRECQNEAWTALKYQPRGRTPNLTQPPPPSHSTHQPHLGAHPDRSGREASTVNGLESRALARMISPLSAGNRP